MSLEQPKRASSTEALPLRRYVYKDNLDGRKVVFECDARGILEADEKYTAATGMNSTKQPHVGVSFTDLEEGNGDAHSS